MKTMKSILNRLCWTGIGILTIILIISCFKEEIKLPPIENDDLQMMEYIEQDENKEKYSEFEQALNISNLTDLLRTRGPYTLFIPNNDAMKAYYQKIGVSGLDQIDPEKLRNLVLNHLLAAEIKTTDMSDACLPNQNAIGDFLVCDFDYVNNDIIINKYAVITNRDNECANGYVHEVGSVIEIIENNLVKVLSQNPGYSIFYEALEKTGIADTLQVIEIPYGRINARVRYTILAVPDSIYGKENIYSFDDLANKYGDGSSDYTDIDNPIFKYVDYHCLEGTYYKHDFVNNTTYYTISRENQVTVKLEDGYYKFEYSNSSFTTIIDSEKNIPAKNGVIHGINGVLLPAEVTTGLFKFQFTDYLDLHAEECYREQYISNFYQEDYFYGIKWGGGDYLQYYTKETMDFDDNDCISTSESYWWIEYSLPKIRKGKYLISLYTKSGDNRANVIVYIDGVKQENVIYFNDKDNGKTNEFTDFEICEIEWTETKPHKFLFKTVSPGILFMDHMKFQPID